MAVNNSPAKFVFNDSRKKSYESGFPGLVFPNPQNAFEEVGLHKQLSKTFDEFNSKEFKENPTTYKNNENVTTDQNVTPKSQKPSDVKRWASVVKAQRKLHPSGEVNDKLLSEDLEVTLEKFESIIKTFPKSFESHKGFFVMNDQMIYCNICSLNLDSDLSLPNHLKTRKHEDSVIEFFRSKMPTHLHYTMEFVSFYGSNLCCNLCQCSIPMSSHNAYETIVNIMAHNSDESHVSQKVNRETCNSAETILRRLSGSSSIIMENLHLIERKMVPEFKCQLCKKFIIYDDSKDILTRNFISHLKSFGHMKNQKAVEVLKLLGEASLTGKDNWTVVNGNIMCTYCNREFEADLQQLLTHANDVEHAKSVLLKMGISSNFKNASENDTLQENIMNEAKSVVLNNPKKLEVEQKQFIESICATKSKTGSRLKELLKTLPPGLRNVDYVIENEKGSITCLVCNRVVPPSTYNLRTHLLGNRHKTNMVSKNEVVLREPNNLFGVTSSRNPIHDGSIKPQSTVLTESGKSDHFLADISRRYGFVLITDKNSATCAICQYPLLNPYLAQHHLASDEHKKMEEMWLKGCSGCSSRDPFTNKVLKSLPSSIRMYKCRPMDTIPASVLNHLYLLLLKENQQVKNNEKFLVKNVDGKNSYCSLCKTLIPLSLDLDSLENNIVSHINGKHHQGHISAKNENLRDVSNSPKVARSLFELPDIFKKMKMDSKIYNFEDFSRLICNDTKARTKEDLSTGTTNFCQQVVRIESDTNLNDQNDNDIKNPENEVSVDSDKKTVNHEEVFVFGKTCKNDDPPPESSTNFNEMKGQNGALPVSDVTRLVKFEEETSEDVLNRRQKQIDYGKNTEGYARYSRLIPRRKRGVLHPVTPPMHLRCSRRTWDGMIRAWRRQLHSWDPPNSTLESDIRPLD